MQTLLRVASLSLAVALAAAPAVGAQQRSTRISRDDDHGRQRYSMTMTDDNRTLRVLLDGRAEFNDDDTDVVSLENGAVLVIDEHVRGQPARRIEFRSRDGGISRVYTVNGETSADAADQKAWLARIRRTSSIAI